MRFSIILCHRRLRGSDDGDGDSGDSGSCVVMCGGLLVAVVISYVGLGYFWYGFGLGLDAVGYYIVFEGFVWRWWFLYCIRWVRAWFDCVVDCHQVNNHKQR